ATSSIVVTVSVSIRAAVFIATGLLAHAQILLLAGLLVPAMFAGYLLGNRLHHALSRRRVIHLIAALLVANGALLVLRALAVLREE
ncbi:MAG: sulfite exporter TauE/SafE family protein, partial [Betaproteobacteria bacterium]|nr:sulfite exporter TauE/SafE family protein [Betaproteobacteria bacterium]